jgi:hypothetical protein
LIRALALIGVAVLLAGCNGRDLAEQARPLPSPTMEPVTQGNENTGRYKALPSSARIEEGVVYEFKIYTHCGLDAAPVDFDGSFWEFEGGVDDTPGSAPEGWGDPFDSGVITLVAENKAEFDNLDGGVVTFTRRETRVKSFGVCA